MPNDLFSGWFGALALLTSVACGGSQQGSNKVELPSEVGELPADLEDDFRMFAINCSKCHGLERPLTAPVTDHKHWERYVAKMMRTPGSGISAQEAPQILAFLFWYTDRRSGRIKDEAPGEAVEQPAQVVLPASSASPAVPAPQPAMEPAAAPQGEGTP
jgi:hypothetical protein